MRLAGAIRYWLVAPSSDGLKWRYERLTPAGYASGEMLTPSEAREHRREFDSEIAAARAEGWD